MEVFGCVSPRIRMVIGSYHISKYWETVVGSMALDVLILILCSALLLCAVLLDIVQM